MKEKELHMCYIDIQKAYDLVEYWALDLILKKYGFNNKFRNIIQDICKDTTCNIILPYRLSNTINITRGVRQRCPLSPILFIIFLEPLMLILKESNRGYDLEDELPPIPGGAYTDDMVLYANTNHEVQYLFNECIGYFNFVGLSIAFDGRDKSIYTNNVSHFLKIYIDEKNKNRDII